MTEESGRLGRGWKVEGSDKVEGDKVEDSNKVEDSDYDCGFCTREITRWNDAYSSNEYARPCSDCLMPRFLEVLKMIEGDLSSISHAIYPE